MKAVSRTQTKSKLPKIKTVKRGQGKDPGPRKSPVLNQPRLTQTHTSGTKPLETLGGQIQATKFDGEKPRFALIPARAEREVAKVYTKGAVKYDVGNWHSGLGFDYDRPISATRRHINDFQLGKRIDDGPGGTGTHILANAICELMFLLEFELSEHGRDNREKAQYLPDGIQVWDPKVHQEKNGG